MKVSLKRTRKHKLPYFLVEVEESRACGNYQACTKWLPPFFVYVKVPAGVPKCLLEHEETHVEQFYRSFFVGHWWRYRTDKEYAYQSEIEAYCRQIGCLVYRSQRRRAFENAVKFITKKYRFSKDLDPKKVRADLLIHCKERGLVL